MAQWQLPLPNYIVWHWHKPLLNDSVWQKPLLNDSVWHKLLPMIIAIIISIMISIRLIRVMVRNGLCYFWVHEYMGLGKFS